MKSYYINEITKKLKELDNGAKLAWFETSDLLDKVDRFEFWQEVDGAASFTEWLQKNSIRFDNKESSLWRFLTVGRYYKSLRSSYDRIREEYPVLQKLPAYVSPEKLEILAKLQRVAPKFIYEPLIYRVLENLITRNELRQKWEAFRPALRGRTARGRKASTPKVNLNNEEEYKCVSSAVLIDTLIDSGSEWLGKSRPVSYDIRVHAWSDASHCDPDNSHLFDAIIMYKSEITSQLEIHAIEIISGPFSKELNGRLKSLTAYCDFLWLAISEGMPKQQIELYPTNIGIILVKDSVVSVIRRALPSTADTKKANSLLKELLSKGSRL